MQGEEILSQASTSANTTAAEEEEEEEDAGGGEESEGEESDVVRGRGGLVNNHINYNWWRAVGLCQWGKSSVRGRACSSRSLINIKKDWKSKVNCTVYLYWILSILSSVTSFNSSVLHLGTGKQCFGWIAQCAVLRR